MLTTDVISESLVQIALLLSKANPGASCMRVYVLIHTVAHFIRYATV